MHHLVATIVTAIVALAAAVNVYADASHKGRPMRRLSPFTPGRALALSLVILAGLAAAAMAGTRGPDNIKGNDRDNVIHGGRSADTIYGGGGNDALHGGTG